jgi:limonene-1,2-epoxide hydrolase
MSDPASVVTAFVAEFAPAHPDVDRIMGYFADDAVYHNMPVEPLRGREAIRQGISGFVTRMESGGWEVLHQAVAGDVVLNERIDRFKAGDREIALPVAGVFRVRDGKITEWRDYFDMGAWQRQTS